MSLIKELKKRKVFRVAAVYAVVAWGILQVVDVVSEPLNLPAWFPAMVTGDNIRGFVYTFNLGTTEATRVTGEPLGREHIYLGLPNQSIAQWWAVRADKRTFGPLPYNNAELTAGAGHNVTTNPGWSTNPLELA